MPVHPRVCGERGILWELPANIYGSSPRVRGTRPRRTRRHHRERFIPACAGNARPTTTSSTATAVHPRVCGERPHPGSPALGRVRFIPACAGNAAGVPCIDEHGDGSSPRVRGTREGKELVGTTHRFIPACAGNAIAQPHRRPHTPVHPRVCGERAPPRPAPPAPPRFIPACAGNAGSRFTRQNLPHGSSPRVRGTRATFAAVSGCWRFIPACAGNAS